MVPDPSDDPKTPRSPRKPGDRRTPLAESGGRQTVEDWLAQKLAALDPDEEESLSSAPPKKALESRSTPDPAETPPTAIPARSAPPPPIEVPAADEWPDLEPLTLPSDEIEPLDPIDEELAPSEPLVAPPPDARAPLPRDDRRRTPSAPPVARGRSEPDGEGDDGMWDLFGEVDTRPPHPPALSEVQPEARPLVQPEARPLVQPEARPLVQPEARPPVQPDRPSPPVVTSASAPGRVRTTDEARVDALIAEVERSPRKKTPPPIRVTVRSGEADDPHDRSRTPPGAVSAEDETVKFSTLQPLSLMGPGAARRAPESRQLAEEQTEIRPFVPATDDAPTLIDKQAGPAPDESWMLPDDEEDGPGSAAVGARSRNVFTWLMVAAGMLAFGALLLGLGLVIVTFLRV